MGCLMFPRKLQTESPESLNQHSAKLLKLFAFSCKYDSPAYVSYPHFLHGDPMLINQFENGTFHPTRKEHESYITLEPLTGVPLEVAVKLQINVLTRPVSVPVGEYEAQIEYVYSRSPFLA